ncbi:MAG: hypothetical protein HYT08_05165 [Candidatus Levybacteria bacterium]|nr:hypothetical protein [Candidatus Levybacteria bacterium]
MTATGHAIIGTLIAAKFGDPTLAVPLAFGSHIVADALPHWDEGVNPKKSKQKIAFDAVIDVIAGFIISYLIVFMLFPGTNLFYVFILILVSQSLDWITAPYYLFGVKPFKIFYKFQKLFDNPQDKPWGIINQVVILVILIALAKLF